MKKKNFNNTVMSKDEYRKKKASKFKRNKKKK